MGFVRELLGKEKYIDHQHTCGITVDTYGYKLIVPKDIAASS
jgi:hypothetical protein